MRLHLLPLILLTLGMFCEPALAYRREYRVTWEGETKEGSEVCFYRGRPGDLFTLFFSYETVTCLPGDKILDLPPGMFHAFARHRDGYVSADRDYFVYNGPPAPEAGYELLEIPLQRAAYLDLQQILETVKPNQKVGVWVAPSPLTIGTFLPRVAPETVIMIPGDTPVLPLVLENDQPVAIGDVVMTPPGRTEVARIASHSNVVIGWAKMDQRTAAELERETAGAGPEVAQFRLNASLGVYDPLFKPFDPLGGSQTFLFFTDIPAGTAKLQVRGKHWIGQDISHEIPATGVFVERRPLNLLPGASLNVLWNGGPGEGSNCKRDDIQHRPSATILLATCTNPQQQEESCTVVARRSVPFATGTASFGGLRAGEYLVTFHPPDSSPIRSRAVLLRGRDSRLEVPRKTFGFFGRVTENQAPLRARLVFATGEAESDSTGRYSAALAGAPHANLISILPCDDERVLRHVPKNSIEESVPYDIALDLSHVDVKVNTETGEAIGGADVTFAPVKGRTHEGEPVIFYESAAQRADSKGRARIVNLPRTDTVIVCARHPMYERACSEPFDPAKVLSDGVVVRLSSVGIRGIVRGHEGTAMVALVDSSGSIVDRGVLAHDGAFTWKRRPRDGEYAIYVSDRRPLFVYRLQPSTDDGDPLVITPPAIQPRSFVVRAAPTRTRETFVGLWVEHLYVPLDVWVFHQDTRGSDVELRPGSELTIRDILAAGPIHVAAAEALPPGREQLVSDVFALPENRGVRRHEVTSTHVTLP
jgi:hypothetical protein